MEIETKKRDDSLCRRQSISIENVFQKQNIVRRTSTGYKNAYFLTEKGNSIRFYSIDIELLTE